MTTRDQPQISDGVPDTLKKGNAAMGSKPMAFVRIRPST